MLQACFALFSRPAHPTAEHKPRTEPALAPICCASLRSSSVALTPGPSVRWKADVTRWRSAGSLALLLLPPRSLPRSEYCTCAHAHGPWRHTRTSIGCTRALHKLRAKLRPTRKQSAPARIGAACRHPSVSVS